MVGRLVAWVEKWAEHHHAKTALSVVSFVESSFFPIPPFVLIVAMLSNENKPSWVRLAIIGTLSSVLGGIFGYFIGKFFYAYLGAPLIAFYGLTEQVESLGQVFKDNVFITIFIASITPVPYKVFTLSAGLFSVNLLVFILASLIGRGIRFTVVSYLSDKYGLWTKQFVLNQQRLINKVFAVALLLGVIYLLLL